MDVPNKTPLFWTLAQIATIWLISDVAFYIVLPAWGIRSSYNAEPVYIALYYLFWIIVTFIALRPTFKNWRPLEGNTQTYVTLLIFAAAIVYFVAYVLPQFPPIEWTESWKPPSELLFAESWYFLPKSLEILLQQLLVAALVLSFNTNGFSLRATSIWCAVLFGGIHILLIFGGSPAWYVARFGISAFLAGAVFPYLLIRTKNGFAYAYMLHWLYYAGTVVLIHTVSPYAG